MSELTPWDEAAYRSVTGAQMNSLEGQWGSVPGHDLAGRIVEIYRDGTYLLETRDPEGIEEHLITDSDPRLFEVDSPW